MNNEPEAPKPEENAESSAPAAAPAQTQATRAPSPTVLVMLFVIVGLLVMLVVMNADSIGGTADNSSSPYVESRKADLETARLELNRQRIALGLEPLAGSAGIEAAAEVAARIKTDANTLASLAESFGTLLEAKDREIEVARQEAVDALKELRRVRELLDGLRTERDNALLEASRTSTLQTALDAANSRIALLEQQLVQAGEAPARLQQQLLEVQAERDRLLSQVSSLEAQLAAMEAKLNQVSLFAATENEIIKDAIALVRELRKLEGQPDSEIMSAYSNFGKRLGSEVLRRCDFATGSSDVAPELEASILQTINEVPDGALIFIVGYASKTGNVDSNRQLSSDRATAVARILDASKRPGQRVQAVYLGQTDRFSSSVPERNQIVEIWQIVPPSTQ